MTETNIRQSDVNKPLMGKFPEEDIVTASALSKARVEQLQLGMRLSACHELCSQCPKAHRRQFAIPTGSLSSSYMLILPTPDEEDVQARTIGFGPSTRFISMMLTKLGHNPHETYVTSLSKCLGDGEDDCLSSYFWSEYARLSPRVLILSGETVKQAFEVFYNIKLTLYEPKTINGTRLVALPDLQDVLTQTGVIFSQTRKNIWQALKRNLL